ncbi:MAG: hypothetical protein K0R06_5 [Clostridium sp.]|jgi:hypothetical protein|nr:hypothetical protein [Clostridium sp.]
MQNIKKWHYIVTPPLVLLVGNCTIINYSYFYKFLKNKALNYFIIFTVSCLLGAALGFSPAL